jgi:hypothetical protein
MVPQQVAISSAASAFNEDGSLANEAHVGQVKAVVDAVVRTAGALKG